MDLDAGAPPKFMHTPPSKDGRDSRGQFSKGNKASRGNPHARRVGELRSALLGAVSPEDLMAIVAKLVDLAKQGDIPAAKEILTRTLGKPHEHDLLERLERLELAVTRKVAV